jgi:hypothetical protein
VAQAHQRVQEPVSVGQQASRLRPGSHWRPKAIVRRALLLPLAGSLMLTIASAQACEKHLRGHSSGSDSAAQINQN